MAAWGREDRHRFTEARLGYYVEFLTAIESHVDALRTQVAARIEKAAGGSTNREARLPKLSTTERIAKATYAIRIVGESTVAASASALRDFVDGMDAPFVQQVGLDDLDGPVLPVDTARWENFLGIHAALPDAFVQIARTDLAVRRRNAVARLLHVVFVRGPVREFLSRRSDRSVARKIDGVHRD